MPSSARRGLARLLAALVIVLALTLPAFATQDDSIPASGYVQQQGEQFFLLADASFASDEQAKVRLEAPGRDFRRYLMEGYGGADIRVYRVPDPLAFLQQQKNLHRVQTSGNFRGEGLANALSFLWDSWYRLSRRAMQKAFSYPARKAVTEEAPALSMGEAIRNPTQYAPQPQFAPMAGMPLVDQFRYPLWDAKPIAPPEDVELAGSSSEFIEAADGNVYIPIGRLKPGMYIVEALVGNYRATTAVFVSDTVAITKIAGQDLLIWTARKHEGTAVRGAKLLWTDGLGVLTRGQTDRDGLLRLTHASPERSYVLGEDADGGVFVSENFYYDSEIYNTKLYAFTDRPLYRPGDWVEVKILGRHFTNARDSAAPAAAPIALSVIDANGTALQTLKLDFNGQSGAAGRFQLPVNAVAGGYELRFSYQGQLYSSAMRVAEYIKPHFEIVLDLAKPDFRTGEAVRGQLTLVYPDGKPVAGANIEISLRAQQLSMVDNELQYLGQFPIELTSAKFSSDAAGHAALNLPAADKPSRYLLTVYASDGAAFRVKASKEILIERGAAQYRLSAAQRFSAAGETVEFRYAAEGQAGRKPTRYEWIRLEDQSGGFGDLASDADRFSMAFDQPGTYTLTLKDEHGLIVGATGHAVSGDGIKASAGSIEIVLDQSEYQAGATAEALITFPEPVAEALLTLERDSVQATALLSDGGDWLKLKRLSDTQYRARIPVTADFAPNLTFSVLYTKGGDYSFQNAGIKVTVPSIDVAIKADREVYKPGDTVTVDLDTTFAGKGRPTRLTVSVVDEMIYALQPEIAPAIGDFFYHPRRNNVRTSASLAFISYDVALPGSLTAPSSANRSERAVKVLERPRREEIDTAAWQPDLVTDASGHARFSFKMPDSLTRWRITARAIDGDGVVGQRKAFVRSEMPLYLKWSGPTRFRAGDAPELGLLAFNQSSASAQADLSTTFAGNTQHQPVSLAQGVNYLPLPSLALASGDLTVALEQAGKPVDALSVSLHADTGGWTRPHSLSLPLAAISTPLKLPADARDLELRLASGNAALFRGSLDDLLDYPWGCVEQTASRLLPLSLAYPELAGADTHVGERLRLIMQTSRMRLVQMAGPNARFSWWGDSADEDAFLTAYAYYADWHASRALGLSLPAEHWQRVLELYAEKVVETPLLQRALILDFAQAMDLPVQSLLQALLSDLADARPAAHGGNGSESPLSSLVLNAPDSALGLAAARVLAARLAADTQVALPASLPAGMPAAEQQLAASALPFAKAVLLHRAAPDVAATAALYARLAPEYSTLERALTLSWLGMTAQTPAGVTTTATALATGNAVPSLTPAGGWLSLAQASGALRWRWPGAQPPATLDLISPPAPGATALLTYESDSPLKSSLPIRIKRHLWQLDPSDGEGEFPFLATAVVDLTQLSADRLYLDEIVLTGDAERPLRYGLLEVPLPPGADVERTTWGISVLGLGGDGALTLEKARQETGELRYAVPVDTLAGEVRFSHLVRFSQKGRFALPPVRYQRMYAPEQQAFEADPALTEIEVR